MSVRVKAELAESEHRIIGWNPIRGGSPQKPNFVGQFVPYGDVAVLEAEGIIFNSGWDLDEETDEAVYTLSFQIVIVQDARAEEAEEIELEGDEPDVKAAIAEIEGDDEEEGEEEDEGHDA